MKKMLFSAVFAIISAISFAEEAPSIIGTWEQIGNDCDAKGVCEKMNDHDIFWQFRTDKKVIISYHYKINGNLVVARGSQEQFDIIDFFKNGSVCLRSQKSREKTQPDINLLYWHNYGYEKGRVTFMDYERRVMSEATIIYLDQRMMLVRTKGSSEIVKFIRNDR